MKPDEMRRPVKGGGKLDHWGGRKLGQEKCWNGWNEVF
jgi:hypothetical protein